MRTEAKPTINKRDVLERVNGALDLLSRARNGTLSSSTATSSAYHTLQSLAVDLVDRLLVPDAAAEAAPAVDLPVARLAGPSPAAVVAGLVLWQRKAINLLTKVARIEEAPGRHAKGKALDAAAGLCEAITYRQLVAAGVPAGDPGAALAGGDPDRAA